VKEQLTDVEADFECLCTGDGAVDGNTREQVRTNERLWSFVSRGQESCILVIHLRINDPSSENTDAHLHLRNNVHTEVTYPSKSARSQRSWNRY
jgi:hypothetical protein